jgi:hypothetical protein
LLLRFAYRGTASIQRSLAFITLNEQQMAGIIQAVHMRISSLSANMTMRQNIIRDPFTQSFIKNKVFPNEKVRQTHPPNLVYIVDDTAL